MHIVHYKIEKSFNPFRSTYEPLELDKVKVKCDNLTFSRMMSRLSIA